MDLHLVYEGLTSFTSGSWIPPCSHTDAGEFPEGKETQLELLLWVAELTSHWAPCLQRKPEGDSENLASSPDFAGTHHVTLSKLLHISDHPFLYQEK